MKIYSYLVWLLLSVGLLFPSFAQDTKDKDRTMAKDTATQQTPSQDKPIPLTSTQSEDDFLKTPAAGTVHLHLGTMPIYWMNMEMEYFAAENFSIGPRLDMGFWPSVSFFIPSFRADVHFDNVGKKRISMGFSLGVSIATAHNESSNDTSRNRFFAVRTRVHGKIFTYGLAMVRPFNSNRVYSLYRLSTGEYIVAKSAKSSLVHFYSI